MTHAELVIIAEKWLLGTKKCSFALTELVCFATSEIPDAIGWKSSGGVSILVECKTSRADFLADAKKFFRIHGWQGVGTYRFYMCPEDVIQVSDLPDKWGLIWVNKDGKPRQIHGPKNPGSYDSDGFHHEANIRAENGMMSSALRRLHLHGVLHLVKPEHAPYNQLQADKRRK